MSPKRIALLALVLAVPLAAPAGTRWEIEPKESSALPAGKLALIGGATSPDGINFFLPGLELNQPVQVSLVSVEEENDLTLALRKQYQAQPLQSGTTGEQGVVTFRFRSLGEIDLIVSGPRGARYELVAWVAPDLTVPPPPATVPMEQYLAARGGDEMEPASAGSTAPAGSAQVAGGQSSPVLLVIAVFLGLILLALIAIIFLWLRQKKKGAASAGIILLLVLGGGWLSSLAGPSLLPQGTPSADVADFAPGLLSPDRADGKTKEVLSELQKISRSIHNVRKWLEKGGKGGLTAPGVMKPGNVPEIDPKNLTDQAMDPGNYIGALTTAIAWLESYGVIEPREAHCQADYSPKGIPALPSRCPYDADCMQCARKAFRILEMARKQLENNYVAFCEVALKTQRIVQQGEWMSSLHPLSSAYWNMMVKNHPDVLKSKQNFLNKYDAGQDDGLKGIHWSLLEIGKCERKHFGAQDWYVRYGLPFEEYMKERYLRTPKGPPKLP